MLKTRKIIKSTDDNNYGNYQGVYGQGSGNFIYGADALAQILTHKQSLTLFIKKQKKKEQGYKNWRNY